MFRRKFLIGLLLAPLALAAAPALCQEQPIFDADTMKKILRPPTEEDALWLDKIVKKVNRGKLPVDLVESTLIWARKKGKNRFEYFKNALILRAERQGISIKP
jgi:hypothetical protein